MASVMDLLEISAETNVVEVYRLAVDAHHRRGNPVGKLTWLDHTAIGRDFGARQRTDVTVESFVRGCQLEGNASLFNDSVPTLNAAFGVGDVVVAQNFIQCVEHRHFFFNQLAIFNSQDFVGVAF